jgi:8-oxo-dGTP diphosphatase
VSPTPAKKKYAYDYPRPSVTVDVVVVTRERRPRVLLIRRKHDPFAGKWAIPGGFIEMAETLEESARRELREETGLEVGELAQLGAYGDPNRDPRDRIISVAYLARIDAPPDGLEAADDAKELAWHRLDALPELAFDHDKILAGARRRLRMGRA